MDLTRTKLIPTREMREFIPPEDSMITNEKTSSYRLILGVDNYSEFENSLIADFKQFARTEKFTDEEILRALLFYSRNHQEVLEALKTDLEWRKNYSNIRNFYEIVQPLLSSGAVYIHGRDQFYRPIIIMNLGKVNFDLFSVEEYTNLFFFHFQFMIDYMLVPGHVENWVLVVDLADKSLLKLPINKLKNAAASMPVHFTGRMAKAVIVNAPSSLKMLWSLVSKFLGEATLSKVTIGGSEHLLKIIDPEQLEQQYGGTTEDTRVYWPPVIPAPKTPIDLSDIYQFLGQPPLLHYTDEGRHSLWVPISKQSGCFP